MQPEYIRTVLTESMSTYYLGFLKHALQTEKDPARLRRAPARSLPRPTT